jgi:RNA polymerase sigma factor (sigma-70 family)
MVPKIERSYITPISEKSVKSIFDWFDLNKQSYYALGWSYLGNQQQMEELFYQTIIKVHKQFPRFKNETSFETWVTSIFITICRELSENRSLLTRVETESRQDIFKALDQLKVNEKEVLVLTYLKGIPMEEVARLLQVSVEKTRELLLSGIQSLRNEMGERSLYNGCKEYQKDYIDYLERTLARPKKIELEKHIYHCPDCQGDLGTFQDVMLTLINLADKMEAVHVPSGFMESIMDRLEVKEKQRQKKNKKRIRNVLVFAGIFTILIGIELFTGVFSKSYYTWTEKDQELRAFLQQDLGESLNLEAESDGVKIKIKSAIADEVQTLVFYEIEDTEEDNQYFLDAFDGVFVENDYKIMNTRAYPRYYPPDLEGEVNTEKKNVYHGRLSLQPLTSDNGTIKLKITKINKLIREAADQNGIAAYGGMESETGEWNFEIPVTKQPSVEYALDEETIVEGIPVRFDKLSIAPTATVLQYGINIKKPGKRIDVINFNNLEVNNKKVKADSNGGSFLETTYEENWIPMQTHFEPLFVGKPTEVKVQFESVYFTIEEPKTIVLDASQEYPQTFEYAGSTMSIDKVEVGHPTIVVISNPQNRSYEFLNFQIVGENESEIVSMEMNSEGVSVDKNGVEYNMNEPISYEEIEQPHHYITVFKAELHPNTAGENIIPKRLEIYGYNSMNYLDDIVEISLE